MKLTGSRTGPYTRKMHAILAEKKIDYQFMLEDVWNIATQIHQLSPLDKVPCLVMDDGGTLLGSRVVAKYADTLSPVAHLIPPSSREHMEVRCWKALVDDLLDTTFMLRIEHMQHTPEQRSETWLARQNHKTDQVLQTMSQDLADRTWCNGNHLTLANVAIGYALAYLDLHQPQVDWRERHADLATFYTHMEKRPNFMETQPQ